MKITQVKKDGNGTIQAVKLDNGAILEKDEAIELAQVGELQGVEVRSSKSGTRYLRSIPDDSKGNNLDKLPEF